MKTKFVIVLAIVSLLLAGCSTPTASTTATKTEINQPPTTQATVPPTTQPTVPTSSNTTTKPGTTTTSVVPTTKPSATPTKTVIRATTNIPLISAADLYNNYVKLHYNPANMETEMPNYQTIDCRGLDQYNAAHVPAAINIPPSQYGTDSEEQSIRASLMLLPKDQLLVFYDDNFDLAPVMAQHFLDLNKSLNWGFDPANVKIMGDGYVAWTTASYPSLSAAQ